MVYTICIISNEKIDQLLVGEQTEHKENYPDLYIRHYIEQYRIYLRVLGNVAERRQQSNEFFLGINTAIMAVLGYIETKEVEHSKLIFTLVPFIGIVICHLSFVVASDAIISPAREGKISRDSSHGTQTSCRTF